MSTPTPPATSSRKTLALWTILVGVFIATYQLLRLDDGPSLPFSELQRLVQSGEVTWVTVESRDGLGRASGRRSGGARFQVEFRPIDDFVVLEEEGLEIDYRAGDAGPGAASLVLLLLPSLVVVLLFWQMLRGMKNPKLAGTLQFEPVYAIDEAPVRLKGLDDVRARLKSAVESARTGSEGPRRILLVGPPGSGKTQLARAAAVDSKTPVFAASGARFVETFVGVGAARIRKVFEVAAKLPHAVLILDDIDAFATTRVQADIEGRVDERGATLLELNNALDGLAPLPKGLVVIATSNRPELLDPALTRPGRFDLRITLAGDGTATIEETPAT